jgi:superfamily I DNA and RNA helicase
MSQFITTEPLNNRGEAAERLVWDGVKTAFADRECLAYWRYPIFSPAQKFRKEPDILILDLELGIIILEVKAINIDQIVNITGHCWEYKNFYKRFNSPYKQIESQLFSLLEYVNLEPVLRDKITARGLIALPKISQQQWQDRGFDKLPFSPPILFREDIQSLLVVTNILKKSYLVVEGNTINQHQWEILLSVVAGTKTFSGQTRQVLSRENSKGKILNKVRSHLYNLDLQQEHIAKEIPLGPQRIRGIAGSGKTVLLCQKAVNMHLKNPQWKIAVVFFSRSLYDSIVQQVATWLSYFTNNQKSYNLQNPNLLILHAWGSKNQPGLYSTICQAVRVNYLTVSETHNQAPNESLAEACLQLLKEKAIPQIFDALLIDEAQDLLSNNWKFQDKQPFYWLAYQSLRPADPIHPEQKRLIWAYDEFQSLDSLKIPTASELLGENLGHLVTGSYPDGIKKTEVMSRCYRTPEPIIKIAHILSLGLLRPQGILTAIQTKEEWKSLGYEVEGILATGETISLKRQKDNSPHPLTLQKSPGKLISFYTYQSRQQELTALARNIMDDMRYEGLRPSREILVVVLGPTFEAMQLENHIAKFLLRQKIDVFVPGISQEDTNHPNQFWREGAVTVSRIHRAKGNEADMVYLVGLDNIANDEGNIYLRHQLLIALTRTRAWVKLTGVGDYPFYKEVEEAIKTPDKIIFTMQGNYQREVGVKDRSELLRRFALGGKNFQNADLEGADLRGVNLTKANLIGANLRGAQLSGARLDEVKLVSANLSYSNLVGASLRKAKLMGANLEGANLTNADCYSADLSNAQLLNTTLSGVNLENADLTGAFGAVH